MPRRVGFQHPLSLVGMLIHPWIGRALLEHNQ